MLSPGVKEPSPKLAKQVTGCTSWSPPWRGRRATINVRSCTVQRTCYYSLHRRYERETRIELASPAWKAGALPLSYSRWSDRIIARRAGCRQRKPVERQQSGVAAAGPGLTTPRIRSGRCTNPELLATRDCYNEAKYASCGKQGSPPWKTLRPARSWRNSTSTSSDRLRQNARWPSLYAIVIGDACSTRSCATR